MKHVKRDLGPPMDDEPPRHPMTTMGIRDFLTYRRDNAAATLDARKVEWEADYGAEAPMSVREDRALWIGAYEGEMYAYGEVLREFAGDVPHITAVIDRHIESAKTSQLHSRTGSAEHEYFSGGVQALRELRRELLGDVRTTAEQAAQNLNKPTAWAEHRSKCQQCRMAMRRERMCETGRVLLDQTVKAHVADQTAQQMNSFDGKPKGDK